MSIQTATVLKTYFEAGDFPTEAQFVDLIDSTAGMLDGSYGQAGKFSDLITKDGPWIDVRASPYNCVGDWNGTTGTDDTAGMKLAIAAGMAANKPVRLSGMHKITSTLGPYDGDSTGNTGALIIEAPDGKSPHRYGLKYVPTGTGSSLLQVTVSTYPLRVYLRGIALLGDDTANDGVDLNGGTWGASAEIDSCEIAHFGGKGVRIRTGIDTTIRNTKINNCETLISQEAGGLVTTTLRVLSSYLSSATGNGVELRHFYNVAFGENTIFESITGHAIYVDNTYAFQSALDIGNSYFEAIDQSCVKVEQTGGGTKYLYKLNAPFVTVGDGAARYPFFDLDYVYGAEIGVNQWAQTQGSSIVQTRSNNIGFINVRAGYATGGTTGTARANDTAYALGDRVKVTTTSYSIQSDTYWICITAGTSAGSEPAAYTSAPNADCTDGTAVFRRVNPIVPWQDSKVAFSRDWIYGPQVNGLSLKSDEVEYRLYGVTDGIRGHLLWRSVLPAPANTVTTFMQVNPATNVVDFPAGTAIGSGAAIVKHLSGTATWDPASTADGAVVSTTVTVTGAAVGDTVTVGFSTAVPAGALLTGAVTSANTVTVTMFNKTGGALDLASGTLRADVWQH